MLGVHFRIRVLLGTRRLATPIWHMSLCRCLVVQGFPSDRLFLDRTCWSLKVPTAILISVGIV